MTFSSKYSDKRSAEAKRKQIRCAVFWKTPRGMAFLFGQPCIRRTSVGDLVTLLIIFTPPPMQHFNLISDSFRKLLKTESILCCLTHSTQYRLCAI